MPSLMKMFVAYYYDTGKHSFNTTKIVANSHHVAESKAAEWAEIKWPNRVKKIVVERSKGEVVF